MVTHLNSDNIIRASLAHLLGDFQLEAVEPMAGGSVSSLEALSNDLNGRVARLPSPGSDYAGVREVIRAYTAEAVDAEWYLQRYSDVAEARLHAEYHYQHHGRHEFRFPNPLAEKMSVITNHLDGRWYLDRYGDVAAAGVDPGHHFEMHGRYEGRFPNLLCDKREGVVEWFDSEWYSRRYLDVAQSGMAPLEHYVAYGETEGRYPNTFAERNAELADSDFSSYISRLYRKILDLRLSYFEFLAWSRYFKLGLSKDEIRSILQHQAG